MAYIKVLNHSYRLPPVLVVLSEWGLLWVSAYAGIWLRFGRVTDLENELTGSIALKVFTFASVLIACTHALRVYESGLSEGHSGMLLRTLVSYSLLGCSALTILYYLIPVLYLGRGSLAIAVVVALVLVSVFRAIYFTTIGDSRFRRNVLVLGAGERAKKIEQRVYAEGFHGNISVIGFLPTPQDLPHINEEHLLAYNGSIVEIVKAFDIDEIVMAMDERRQRNGMHFQEDELLECKMGGVSIIDVMDFYERELNLVELSELRTSWMLYSDGFQFNILRDILKRFSDIATAVGLLFFVWPIMLVTALLIKLEDGWRAPVIYRQIRVGENGQNFGVLKFRSMSVDAEKDGAAQWAQENDDRITKVGRIIRDFRVDELPQIYNVLRGEMSFVGPRPERPEFVEEFDREIPFYSARHRIKPGLMGWAQLCYPYGASAEDAAQKLRYDLYYIKNHSLLFDLRIFVQTIEVVLIGKGVR